MELRHSSQSIIDDTLINLRVLNEHVLTYKDTESGQIPNLRIQDLVKGRTQEVDDVETLLNNEEVIKSACQAFKDLLSVMSSFGGEEVIEI